MPKIRKKAKLKKIDGSYPEKSGVLSKSIKKIIQDEDSLQGRIPADFLISSNEEIKSTQIFKYYNDWVATDDTTYTRQSLPVFKEELNTKRNIDFDDSKTINFSQQKINYVLGVSSSLANETNIFSRGNHFLTSSIFETNSDIQKINIDYLKINQNLYKEDYRSFDESLKTQNQKSEIILDLPFSDDLILDNFFNENLSHTFSTGDTFYGLDSSIAKNMCYYNFNSKGWDYKVNGDIDFDQPCVVSFTPPTAPHFINSSSSIGLPVQNTGFPFAGHHRGGDQNLITLNDYITNNFILDKIEIEFKLTSRIEKTTADPDWIGSSNVDLANCLTFYILKETSNSVNFDRLNAEKDIRHDKIETDFNNNNSINSVTLNHVPSTYFTNPEIEFVKANPDAHNISEFYTSDYNTAGYTDKFAVFKKIINSNTIPFKSGGSSQTDPTNIRYINKFNDSTQDLVTYANFLVYSNNAGSNSNIDWNYATSDIDLVKEIFPGIPASIHFTSSSFKIESNCRSTLSYNNGGALTYRISNIPTPYDHTIFLSNKIGGRSGLGNLSGREEVGIYSSAKVLNTQNITTGLKFNSITSGSINSPYILKPDDRLIFGIHSFSNISEFPAVFKLHDKIRFRLIGRYENLEDNNITSSNKQGMTSNSVRSTIIGNTTVVNQYDTEPIYFMSGSYLDNRFTGNIKSSSGRTIAGSLSSGLEGSFTRTVTLEDTKNTIYDSIMPNFLNIWKLNNKFPYSLRFNNSGDPDVNVLESSTNIPYTSLDQETTGSFFNHTFSFPFDEENKNVERLLSSNYQELANNLSLKQDKIGNTGYTLISNNTENGHFGGKFILPFEKELGLFEYVEGISGSLMADNNSFSSVLSTDRNFLNHIFGSFTRTKTKETIISYKITKSGTDFLFNGNSPPTLFRFHPNIKYVFDVSDSTMSGTEFSFSTTQNGTHASGQIFTNGVVRSGTAGVDENAFVSLILNESEVKGLNLTDADKTLFYYDESNSNVITTSSFKFQPYAITETISNIFTETNSKFLYNRYLSGFKYGVYNANPVSLTKHFNWKAFGQFSDRYNGTLNTAFFNFDQSVRYPVEKSFVDSEQNSIEASSVADTYNTDEYARSGRPFFD